MHLVQIILLALAITSHPSSALSSKNTGDDVAQIPQDVPRIQNFLDICPNLKVNCVLDGDWRHPVGSLGTRREYLKLELSANQLGRLASFVIAFLVSAALLLRMSVSRVLILITLAFCRSGIRCNQCEEMRNTHECNRSFREACAGSCEAYGPIPF